jgi:hypothetical protein
MFNEGNQIPYTVSVRTFVIPFYYGSDSRTVINYGSGSAKVRNKIMVPVQL